MLKQAIEPVGGKLPGGKESYRYKSKYHRVLVPLGSTVVYSNLKSRVPPLPI